MFASTSFRASGKNSPSMLSMATLVKCNPVEVFAERRKRHDARDLHKVMTSASSPSPTFNENSPSEGLPAKNTLFKLGERCYGRVNLAD